MPVPQATSPNPPPNSRAGRLFFVMLGLAVAGIGLVFVLLMGRSFLRAREMRKWPEVPCVILSSVIEERVHDPQSPAEYRHALSFGYDWQGKALTGDLLSLRGSAWSSKRQLVEKRAAEFPIGKRTTCRVNPSQPALAVLKPDSLGPGYSIWFPSLFVVGGLGIVFRTLNPKRRPTISDTSDTRESKVFVD
jgi:Protein of unknown function (DUF3592)